jgi:hypothetical protein
MSAGENFKILAQIRLRLTESIVLQLIGYDIVIMALGNLHRIIPLRELPKNVHRAFRTNRPLSFGSVSLVSRCPYCH